MKHLTISAVLRRVDLEHIHHTALPPALTQNCHTASPRHAALTPVRQLTVRQTDVFLVRRGRCNIPREGNSHVVTARRHVERFISEPIFIALLTFPCNLFLLFCLLN